ncbi:zinc finger protein 317-like [Malaya genurostris]|uniref:zinc finger protein 317-like n=1 Tax=Malaya genurostris TaxID=325434 RepID=UPI0026F3BE03|nr:zinc finger protein 317-like [Malaya genurostris]
MKKMTLFELMKFPDVCRVCLQPVAEQLLQPLDKNLTNSKLTIAEFLNELTYKVPENKLDMLPKTICRMCVEVLEGFFIYRNRLILTLRFTEALIDLRESNTKPIEDLFETNKSELTILFKELSICSKEEPAVDDLLAEFELYNFANQIEDKIKVELPEVGIEDDCTGLTVSDHGNEGLDVKNFDVDLHDHISDKDSDWNPNEIVYAESLNQKDQKASTKRNRAQRKNSRKRQTLEEITVHSAQSDVAVEGNCSPRKRGRPRIHPGGSFLKEPWSCDKCKFITKYRVAVERHKAVHYKRENRAYPCTECDLIFKYYEEMRSHSLSHPENKVVCEVCGTALKNAYSLKAHMERHEDSRKYSCEYCDYASNTKLALKAHMSIHTKDNWNKRCQVCGVMFRTSSRLKRHMESHENERKYACEQCPVRFNTTNALRNHFIRVHLAIRHSCDHCDKTFDQKIALRDHIERVHHIQCNFICDICVMTFDSQQKLDVHKQRHTNPKPMECSICLTLHLNQDDFDTHLCISYQEDYHCCNKDLRNYIQYNKHMMVKHGMKTNARVKPIPGMLLGQLRGARKRLEQCRKCDIAFPSKALKLEHLAICSQGQQSAGPSNARNLDSSGEV